MAGVEDMTPEERLHLAAKAILHRLKLDVSAAPQLIDFVKLVACVEVSESLVEMSQELRAVHEEKT
jgi:hypothetical protein